MTAAPSDRERARGWREQMELDGYCFGGGDGDRTFDAALAALLAEVRAEGERAGVKKVREIVEHYKSGAWHQFGSGGASTALHSLGKELDTLIVVSAAQSPPDGGEEK